MRAIQWLLACLSISFALSVLTGEASEKKETPRFQVNAKNPSERAVLARGRRFVQAYRGTFSEAERRYHVNRWLVAAVLREESILGIYLHEEKELYALKHLVHRHPEEGMRQRMCFHKLVQQERWDPFHMQGSHCGALGIPQIMPCTYLHFAVDGNGDGYANPWNPEDAIMTVAHVLRTSGWNPRAPRPALMRYNRSTRYVKKVLAFAEQLALK